MTDRRDDGLDRALAEHATWLTVERGLRPNTLMAYRRDLHAYVAFLRSRGISEPEQVDPAAVRAYLAVRSAPDDDGRAPAPATVARALVSLRSLSIVKSVCCMLIVIAYKIASPKN